MTLHVRAKAALDAYSGLPALRVCYARPHCREGGVPATALERRQAIIREIEEVRGTRLVTYITGDRPGGGPSLSLALSMDQAVVPFIHQALRDIGRSDNVDLFLYTRGGQVDAVWPIVSLFREYGQKQFATLVPFRAHSAGTLLLMGADRVVMCEAAELTSVDPTTGNLFNPPDELAKNSRKGISVEDVSAYFSLAREGEKTKLTEPAHTLEVFRELTRQVHPLALGHVQRVYTQIRLIAQKLLRISRQKYSDARIKKIVTTLTEKLYSHTHAVNRQDASQLFGGAVALASEKEESACWRLY